MAKLSYDAVVVGGGIAGVNTSIELARRGLTVALMEKQHDSELRHAKSLFVDGSKLPASLLALGQFHPIPHHKLINADRREDNWGKQSNDVKTNLTFKTGVIQYSPIITALTAQLPVCVDRIRARYISSTEAADTVTVVLHDRTGRTLTTRHLIDASGDASTVSRNHSTPYFKGLISDNPLVAWVYGVRATGEFDANTVYDPIGRDIGATSWVTPLSSHRGDIIASGVSLLSEARLGTRRATLRNLIRFCETNGVCKVTKIERQLGGIIRSEPISLRDVKKSTRVWQIGQAAGMADPLMAEAFSPAYLLPGVLAQFICEGRTPADFYNYWRFTNSMFNYDMMLAMLKRRYAYQQRGFVGSNSEIYKLLTQEMSSEAVRRAVSERRIPLSELQLIAGKLLRNRKLRVTVVELLAMYAKTLLTTNFLQRI